MGTYTFKLPDIGEGIAEAEIAEWKVAVGDAVEEDQALVDMLTDKAAVEIPSPVAGKVLELKGAAGDLMAVGGPLLLLEVEGDGNTVVEAEARQPAGDQEQVPAPASGGERSDEKQVPSPVSGEGSGRGEADPPPAQPSLRDASSSAAPPRGAGRGPSQPTKALASPAVRRRARDAGIELARVPGSGPAGRVTHEDLDAWADGAARPAGAGPRSGVEEIKIIGMRRKIAQAMEQSWRRIPHITYVEELDVTELEALRQHLNAHRREDQAKLTLLPFLVRALDKAVPDCPRVNAHYDDETGVLTRFDGLHVGIATQTDNGLVVPVLRHAEAQDVWGAASEIRRLAEAARSGQASREELSGSSITITSLGAMGGIVTTPIINAPEVAIIGVNKLVERPVFMNGVAVPRLIMNLSSSFDHRIVDGWDAAVFIQRIKSLLEHPASLFMPS